MSTLVFYDVGISRDGKDYVIEQGDQRVVLSPDQARQIASFLNPPKRKAPPNLSGFNEFWEKYPKKEGKAPAMTAWSRVNASSFLRTILADVSNRKNSKQWRDGYIPHPTTYLNQKRWEDQTETTDPFQGAL